MPSSAEEREACRAREWARRLLSSPAVRATQLTLEAAAIIIDVTPGALMAAIECGVLEAERVSPSGDYMVRRGDLLDFISGRGPIVQIVQAVPSNPPSQPEQQPMEGPEKP